MCPNDLPGPFHGVAAELAPGARQLPTEPQPAQDFLCFSQTSTHWVCHDLVLSTGELMGRVEPSGETMADQGS